MDENKSEDKIVEEEQPSQELVVKEPETVFCHKCGAKNLKTNEFCESCGAKLHKEPDGDDPIRCPNCGSTQIEFVTYQASSNFDAGDACCGFILCGPIGLLCGQKDKTPAKTVRKCKKCGHEF